MNSGVFFLHPYRYHGPSNDRSVSNTIGVTIPAGKVAVKVQQHDVLAVFVRTHRRRQESFDRLQPWGSYRFPHAVEPLKTTDTTSGNTLFSRGCTLSSPAGRHRLL